MKKLIALLLSLCLIAGIMPVMAESTRMHENTAEELLSQARTLQDEGSYEEAVPLLQKAADMGDAEAVSAKDMTLTVEEICQAGAARGSRSRGCISASRRSSGSRATPFIPSTATARSRRAV